MIKETFTVKLTYEMSVDSDTGEILETKLIKREINSPQSKKKDTLDEDVEPKLYLEENKYRLNNAAVQLMNLDGDSRLDIKYEQGKTEDFPIIGTEEYIGGKGNKITKSNTVAFKGAKNETLSKYGNEFTLVAHPNKEGIFILTSNNSIPELKGDENVNSEDIVDDDLNFDLDLPSEEDSNVTEIGSDFFKL